MTGAVQGRGSDRWRWIAGLWLAGALFDATQTVFIMHAEGHPGSSGPLFFIELALWLPWALATPIVSGFARRFPLFRGPTLRGVAVHLATFLAISTVAESWSAFLQVQFNPWHNRTAPTFIDTWSVSLLYQVLVFMFVYSLIVTVTFLIDARDKMTRQGEELARAQLAALQGQMEPHFMYNTLNSVAGLVRDRRNDAAVDMIVGLSEFLRRASEDSRRPQVTLREEVEYLQRYLDIQKMRFGERLQSSVEIPAALLGAEVPNLLLQPLVENAIKHGIALRDAGGVVRVSGESDGGMLCLCIYNDAPPSGPPAVRAGVGIGNLRTRLEILYGAASGLQLRHVDGGVEVMVHLPLRMA